MPVRSPLGQLRSTSLQSNVASPAPTYAQKVVWSGGGTRVVTKKLIVAKPAPAAEAGRGRVPTVEIFGEVGVLQAKRGPAPAEVEIFGVKGVFGSARGPQPSKAAAVAQGREAESNSESVRAFLASHPDAELLPGGVVVRCTKTCYEMPAQLEDMLAHWNGRRYRRGYTTERKRREPEAKVAVNAPAASKKEEPTVDPLHAFVASHADAEFLPTGEPWATQPLPYLPCCPAPHHRIFSSLRMAGSVRCSTTGHVMSARLHTLEEHWGGKRYRLAAMPPKKARAAPTRRTNAPHTAHAATRRPAHAATHSHTQPCTATHTTRTAHTAPASRWQKPTQTALPRLAHDARPDARRPLWQR